MLVYDNKTLNTSITSLQLKNNASATNNNSYLWAIVRTGVSIVLSAVSEAANAVIPGIGLALDFALQTVADVVFNIIQNNGNIDYKELGISTLFNAIPFITKGIRHFANSVKYNRFYSVADNISDNTSISKIFKKNAIELNKFGSVYNQVDETVYDLANWKNLNIRSLFNKQNRASTKELINNLKMKNSSLQSELIFNKSKKILDVAQKTVYYARTSLTLLMSPRYAARKLTELALKKPFAKISKTWNSFIDKAIPKKIIKATNKTFEDSIKGIPIESSWLKELKIYKSYNPWNIGGVNALITFKPLATNKKAPVFLFQKNIKEVMQLLQVESPGRYYLNRFAWGWDVGYILRNKSAFLAKSKLPLYATFISNMFYTIKSIEYIAKSLNNSNNWSKNWNANEILSGIKEASTSGLRLKYINPAIRVAKSGWTSNSWFAIKTGMDAYKKTSWKRKVVRGITNRKKGQKW
ncbi:hypothetical protein [Mycoplasma simbae]|uniref:hypothetical protein n=1 Tax=Mycoplasma simbae TaxID=36744 RepID=UPI000497FE42|nr:hypothetical protein [Mycoplasma simbae]